MSIKALFKGKSTRTTIIWLQQCIMYLQCPTNLHSVLIFTHNNTEIISLEQLLQQ